MPLSAVGPMRSTPRVGPFGEPFPVGTPEEAPAVLECHKDADPDEIVIQFNHPGMSADAVARSMRRFADGVMPEVKRWSGRV